MTATEMLVGETGLHRVGEAQREAVQRKGLATQIWALIGAAQLVLIVVVVYRWWANGHMKPTPRGADHASTFVVWFAHGFDIVSPLVGLACVWYFLIRPWRREGHISTEGICCLAMLTLYIPWDIGCDLAAPVFQYNSYSVNMGSWLADLPFTTMPNANLIPEPFLGAWPSYAWGMLLPMALGAWGVRKLKARWPHRGYLSIFAVVFSAFLLFDSFEIAVLHSHWMQYGAAVKEFSLFGSQDWRLPLYETLFYAIFLIVGTAFMYFRDDKGHTIVERGVDALGTRHKTAVRLLATIGFCVVLLNVTYNIPHVLMSLHANSWPADSPSYVTNGACGGDTGVACVGPGTPLPRTHP